jgi:hypothetical protein
MIGVIREVEVMIEKLNNVNSTRSNIYSKRRSDRSLQEVSQQIHVKISET